MRPHEIQNTFKAGIFVSVLMFIVMTTIFTLGKESASFASKINVYTYVQEAGGLRPGAQVKLKGIRIGSISKIEIEELDRLKITLRVTKSHQRFIRENSYVSIYTQGMLGDKYIEIEGGTTDSPIVQERGTILTKTGFKMTELLQKGEDIVSTSVRVLTKIEVFLDQVNTNNNILKTVENFKETTEKLNILLADINSKEVGKTFKNISSITDRIKTGPGTLYSFIYDDSAYDELRTLLGGAQRNKILKYFIRESIKNSERVKQ